MLLRNTKRLFQKTLNSFKSFFSGSDYQRIPKNDHMNTQATYKDLDTFYTDHFTNQWDSSSANKETIKAIKKRPSKKNVNVTPSPMKQETEGSFMKFANKANQNLKTKNGHADSSCLLAEMLKELELKDMSNVDHVLDIEEFLHYYSRLTCPAYVDIVDRFFLEIYAEVFGHSAIPSRIISRPKLRS